MEIWPHSAIVLKGNKRDPCNYRLESLTSVVCKVMERIVNDNVMEHWNEYNVIKTVNTDLLEVARV